MLRHFGANKSYFVVRESFYWPNMWKDLEPAYIALCNACQQNKSPTWMPAGPLHPLPIPDEWGDSIAIDFVGPLPEDQGFDYLITMTDCLNSDIHLIPAQTLITALQLAELFFNHWFCENRLPLNIVSDWDKLFLSQFWKTLHARMGIKLKMSMAYHPENDGASERTHKTIIQALRFHVVHNQKGWVHALPWVHFDLMNTVNRSTGFTPFQLHLGWSPHLLPPLIPYTENTQEEQTANELLQKLHNDVDTLNLYKGLELDLKTECNRKISNNRSLWTANSRLVLLGDSIMYKMNQTQDLVHLGLGVSDSWNGSCTVWDGLIQHETILHGPKWTR